MFKNKKKKGFTLIELLIVVAIIAILAAVAIPQFSAYRVKGYNSAAQSDLKNIVTAEEAYFVDNQSYKATNATPPTGPGPVDTLLPGAKLSKNVKALVVATSDATGAYFTGATAHGQGDKYFGFESDQAKFIAFTKTIGTSMAAGFISAATTVEDLTAAAGWTSI